MLSEEGTVETDRVAAVVFDGKITEFVFGYMFFK